MVEIIVNSLQNESTYLGKILFQPICIVHVLMLIGFFKPIPCDSFRVQNNVLPENIYVLL
jgi:hypothetical protein